MTTALTLRAMTEDEFAGFVAHVAGSFADSQVAAGTMDPGTAHAAALKETSALLPDGLATEGMLLRRAITVDGTPVGLVWIALRHPRSAAGCAFLYDIAVDEAHRGRGYGRALLAAAEAEAATHGYRRLELNVFAANTAAVHLYQTSGYETITQQMRKTLG